MKSKISILINPMMFIVAFLIALLPFSLFAEMKLGISFLAYTDEIICVICIVYYALYFISNTKFNRNELITLLLVLSITLLGLVSNVASRVISNWFPIIVDAICLLKIFLPFLLCIKIGLSDKKKLVALYLEPIAKIVLYFGTLFGTLSQFIDIGMTDPNKRYGLSPFFFIFQNEGRYGYIIGVCLLIILIFENDKRRLLIYHILAFVNMIFTTKGVVYIVLVCYVVLAIMWKRRQKLSVANISILAIAGTFVSSLQINTYLKDFESPRVRLIRYGFITANKFAPLGSGFATYGSDMALKNYSKLYDLYGFNNHYGLSREVGTCLNDCYLGMVVGQFGYVGFVLYLLLLAMCFVPINKIILNNRVKAMCFALFIGLVVSSVGTAIIKSGIGVFVFAVLGLVCGYSQQLSLRNKLESKG